MTNSQVTGVYKAASLTGKKERVVMQSPFAAYSYSVLSEELRLLKEYRDRQQTKRR